MYTIMQADDFKADGCFGESVEGRRTEKNHLAFEGVLFADLKSSGNNGLTSNTSLSCTHGGLVNLNFWQVVTSGMSGLTNNVENRGLEPAALRGGALGGHLCVPGSPGPSLV